MRLDAARNLQSVVRRMLAASAARGRVHPCKKLQAALRRLLATCTWAAKVVSTVCIQASARRFLSPSYEGLRAAHTAKSEAVYWREEGMTAQKCTSEKLRALIGNEGIGYDIQGLADRVYEVRKQAVLLQEMEECLRERQQAIREETRRGAGVEALGEFICSRDEAR